MLRDGPLTSFISFFLSIENKNIPFCLFIPAVHNNEVIKQGTVFARRKRKSWGRSGCDCHTLLPQCSQ